MKKIFFILVFIYPLTGFADNPLSVNKQELEGQITQLKSRLEFIKKNAQKEFESILQQITPNNTEGDSSFLGGRIERTDTLIKRVIRQFEEELEECKANQNSNNSD